ncbi:MAG: ribokinase [Propionibacteriaceae bacterium]
MDIAVIGSNMVDLITYITRMPVLGETVEAPDFQMGCGGKGANQAVAASKLGSKVLMVTRIGDDAFADNTLENFRSHGIDTTHVLRTRASSGVAPIFVDEQSRNSIVIVKGANALLSPADIDQALPEIMDCGLIVLQLEIPLETVYYAIEVGKKHGIPVLLNPAPATADLDFSRIASVDYFVPNESELALLTGRPVATLTDIDAAVADLISRGMSNVIVTLGERGVLWVSKDGRQLIESVSVAAVDTTGAGDAFIGCFSHALMRGYSVPEALQLANRYAADSVTRRGTQLSYATAQELQERTGLVL